MQSVKFDIVTLEPFRQKGTDALDVQGIPGLEQVDLEELKTEYEDDTNHIFIKQTVDLLHDAAPIPTNGALASARLIFHFAGTSCTGTVELRPPDTIAFDTNCNPALVGRWATKNGFALHLQE